MVRCDGHHVHLPWKSGDALFTAAEAEYPRVVCRRAALAIQSDTRVKALIEQLQQAQAAPAPTHQDLLQGKSLLAAAISAAHPPAPPETWHVKAGVEVQHRGSWNLLPEFKGQINVFATPAEIADLTSDKGIFLRDCQVGGMFIHRG